VTFTFLQLARGIPKRLLQGKGKGILGGGFNDFLFSSLLEGNYPVYPICPI